MLYPWEKKNQCSSFYKGLSNQFNNSLLQKDTFFLLHTSDRKCQKIPYAFIPSSSYTHFSQIKHLPNNWKSSIPNPEKNILICCQNWHRLIHSNTNPLQSQNSGSVLWQVSLVADRYWESWVKVNNSLGLPCDMWGVRHGTYTQETLVLVRGINPILQKSDTQGNEALCLQNKDTECRRKVLNLGLCPSNAHGAPLPTIPKHVSTVSLFSHLLKSDGLNI